MDKQFIFVIAIFAASLFMISILINQAFTYYKVIGKAKKFSRKAKTFSSELGNRNY